MKKYFYLPFFLLCSFVLTEFSAFGQDVELAPNSIEGMTLFAKDSNWEIYEEEIKFERGNMYSARVTDGIDNPSAQGTYTYTKNSSTSANLFYSATVGEWRYTFDYNLNFDGRGSGTYEKTADYGDEIEKTSGPFFLSSTTSIDLGTDTVDPRLDGNSDSITEETLAPYSLAGLKVEIHDIEIMRDGSEIDYGKSIKTFTETEVSGYEDDTKQIETDRYEYSIKRGNTALITISHATNDSTVVNLTFSSPTYAEGTWLERDDSGSYEGTITFKILTEENETSGDSYPGGEKEGEGLVPGESGTVPPLDFEGLPVSEVESFVKEFISTKPELQGVVPMWAEKHFDAVKGKDRFVYDIGMNNGISFFFDQKKTFIHSAPSDEFAPVDVEFIPKSDINEKIITLITNEFKDVEVFDAEKEFSSLESDENSFITRVFFNADSKEYLANFTSANELIIVLEDRAGDFPEEWKPVTLPEKVKQYIKDNYGDIVDNTEYLPAEERPTADGTGKEIIIFLGDFDIIYDLTNETFEEINPWKDFEKNLDAGLKFDASRSVGVGDAKLHITKVESNEQSDDGSMLYRISLTQPTVDSVSSATDLELSGLISSNEDVTLTFTYDVGPPRYIIASASNVSAFKHRMPEWDSPGSFTIKAKTVTPVKSASNGSSLLSTFGLTVEMGGERFYEGTIFETNVVNLDVSSAEYSSPWDPAASFKLNGLQNEETFVRALIPRRLLSGNYGIMDPNDVRAALVDKNGTMSFITGSIRESEGDEILIGSSFERKPYIGHEPKMDEYGSNPAMYEDEGSQYKLDDSELGILADSQGSMSADPAPNISATEEGDIPASKIDFDGDGLANSYLEVSFKAAAFPADVQIGDPFIDPFANLDNSQFGKVFGTVKDSQGNALEEFDVWFFKVPESGQDLYSGEPVFFDFERKEDGSFEASLPAGSYHAEAFAYDFSTDTPYKPQLAGGLNSPTVFTIVDLNTNITANEQPSLNFILEQEYRMSHEFADVEASVSLASGGQVEHVFFEMFPVENGARQTDYPVHSFGLDRLGNVKGKVPVGTFEVEVFSPDNSVSANPFTIEVKSGQVNKLTDIVLSQRELISVKGKVTDGTIGIWAEIVFVDPNNSEERFWPMWDESSMDLDEGEFAVKIPSGSYKILAERFDGMYKSTFYSGDKADGNGVVSVVSAIEGLNFTLQSRPTATVTLKLLDKNTSSPIKYAYFDFFDAEDEFAPIVFPHLGPIDFESSSFDGSYSFSVPGGSYKLAIGADNYENVFRVLDQAGQVAYESSTWESGSSLKLTDGNTTDLGTIKVSSLGKSEAELYGFSWLDEGETLSGGSTIKGSLKTSKGVAVPKARVIAHTEDYLFWFDHALTRSDGSFEYKNLPDGDWIIFAEPPFDSETFQGFRESNQTFVSLPADKDNSVNLTLQGSNVFGRVIFPKKSRDSGETKNLGLGHAFVWAYKDEDQDGEPDWDDAFLDGGEELTEAFGETNQDGFFSFYLKEAGKYSLRIDLPGQLGSLSPDPIGFSLKNTNDSVKLGNAIKIDWKSDVRATSFDIERKVSTGSSYISLFTGDMNSSKPVASAKSYVDSSIVPGSTYTYRVIAETSNGQVPIDSSKVRTSDPFIFLAPPSKSISGRVVDSNNTPISNAEVVAWREEGEGWSSTFTGDDGSYELSAGPGNWEITIYRPYDTKVDWVYDAAPQRVKFAADTKKETKSKNFTVSRMAGGKISGSITLPSGVSASDLSKYVFIDAFDPEGRGNWSQPDSSGKFEIPLQPGEYELSIWVDPLLKGYGSPEPVLVRVGKDTVQLPKDLALVSRDKTLTGKVLTTNGGLANVEVWAWSEEGGWVSDTTNINGEYSLAVSNGRWEIGFDLPVVEDGSEPPFLPSPPKRIRIRDGEELKPLNFNVRSAGAKVSGTVYGPTGAPVSNLDAWVYAREYSTAEDDEYTEVLAEVPLSSKGTFSFPSVAGQYLVGIWMPPGSSYGYPAEKVYSVELNGKETVLKDENGSVVKQASFSLAENDSVISGTFKLKGQAVTGLTGEVYAIRVDGDGWQSAIIEDNGTYSFTLSEGNWALDYFIESDSLSRNIPAYPAKPMVLKASKSSAVTQNFDLQTASASISGKVLYDSTKSAITDSSLFVWAYREGTDSTPEYWNEVKSDENGSFSISVLSGGDYEVGAILSEELRTQNYLDSLVLNVNLSSGNITDLNLTIAKPSSSNFISGNVIGIEGTGLEGAIVYAWADDGRENETLTDSNGDFNVSVTSGVIWHVGAEFSEIDENGSESYLSTKFEADIDLKSVNNKTGLSLSLAAPTFKLPDGVSVTFDPTKDFVTKLPDGSELTIPGGAANVASDVTQVRLVITPTAKGLSKSADEKPADYGYSMELFDNKGKKVEGNFKKDVILSIPVDVNASLAKGMDVNNVEAMFYSSTKDSWDKVKTSTWDKNSSKLIMTVDHFTTFAAVAPVDVADISSGVSKMDGGAIGDWYSSDWFGDYHDASSGWIYHTQLGWLYTKQADGGNFWLYEENLGWLWISSTYFEINSTTKSHLYSASKGNWYFFSFTNGTRKFWDYSLSTPDWITP